MIDGVTAFVDLSQRYRAHFGLISAAPIWRRPVPLGEQFDAAISGTPTP
jgi:hypothetical protein